MKAKVLTTLPPRYTYMCTFVYLGGKVVSTIALLYFVVITVMH